MKLFTYTNCGSRSTSTEHEEGNSEQRDEDTTSGAVQGTQDEGQVLFHDIIPFCIVLYF